MNPPTQLPLSKLNKIPAAHLPSPEGLNTNCSSRTAKALFLSQFSRSNLHQPTLIVVNSYAEIDAAETGLEFFRAALPVVVYPSYDTLPYDSAAVDPHLVGKRLFALRALAHKEAIIVIAPINALMENVLPKEALMAAFHNLAVGDNIERDSLRHKLVELGYHNVDQVIEVGEFSWRGDKLDIYPPLADNPWRINFFDTKIESIHSFDAETQISLPAHQERIELSATTEILFTAKAFALAQSSLERHSFKTEQKVAGQLGQKDFTLGFRPFLPLFYERLHTFFDYLPKDSPIVLWDGEKLNAAAESFRAEIANEYVLSLEQGWFTPPVEELFNNAAFLTQQFAKHPQRSLGGQKTEAEPDWQFFEHIALAHSPIHQVTAQAEIREHIDFGVSGIFNQIANLREKGIAVALVARNNIGAERLGLHLKEKNLAYQLYPEYDFEMLEAYFLKLKELPHIPIFIGNLSQGFWASFQSHGVLYFWAEEEIFGRHAKKKRHKHGAGADGITSLAELKVGDYVVHVDHGIGRYLGLSQFFLQAHKVDCLTLEYAGKDKVYVPVDKMQLVQKYSNLDKTPPSLHKIGELRWQNSRKKVLAAVQSIAQDLIELYAKRKMEKGIEFLGQPDFEEEVRRTFPYTETEDQENAINETLADLAKDKPMDRLICGDVGFGKTEVALRAAVRVATSGYQVALVAPTTILAEQHFLNFSARLKDFPLRLAQVSRFLSIKEVKEVLAKLERNEIDIIIGTHRLLSDDVHFAKLGLLVIDEEHRFGVKQKEKIRLTRSNIDTLAMSATPIPRTLHMSLSGIRDISLISTPPINRRSVKSRLLAFEAHIIQESIQRELRRGGQVYFIDNLVETIDQTADYLKQLFPKIEIGIAHGQMDKKQLEDVMHRFVSGQIPILLASTIVESGLDIANANTMIINNADKLGLAQLYQLRGRVGRGDKQAYVYYLVPGGKLLTAEAEKRLTALQQFTELGSGYKLASLDMEIRGVGNFVGHEQSGNIHLVGLDFYLKLLNEAISNINPEIQKAVDSSPEKIQISFGFDTYLPEGYISSSQLRLKLYQDLAAIHTEDELWRKKAEVVDRFGILPKEAEALFNSILLKIYALNIRALSVELYPNRFEIKLSNNPNIGLADLLSFLAQNNGRLVPPTTLYFSGSFPSAVKALDLLRSLQNKLFVQADPSVPAITIQ